LQRLKAALIRAATGFSNQTEADVAKAAIAAAPKPTKGGFPLIAILIVTVLAGAIGGFFGMQVPSLVESGGPAGHGAEQGKPGGPEVKKMDIHNLPPITTNLANPSTTWIRLETAVLVKLPVGPDIDALYAKIAEDLVAYLRTVSLSQLEGPSGFQHLREDLNDRVRARSEGKAVELIIQALVVE
jgi:flagellar FliL protein